MMRADERWRAIRVYELEGYEVRAVREELDQKYEGPKGLAAKSSAPVPPNEINQQRMDLTSTRGRSDKFGDEQSQPPPSLLHDIRSEGQQMIGPNPVRVRR